MKSAIDSLLSLIRKESRRINSSGRKEEGLLFIHYNGDDVVSSACYNGKALSEALVPLMEDKADFADAVVAAAFIFLDSIGTSPDDCADLMKEIKRIHPPAPPKGGVLS